MAVIVLLSSCGASSSDPDTDRVYSGRQYDLERAFTQFTEQTGIKVEFQFGNDAELRERIAAEGENTPADVFISVDAGNLVKAADQGLFRSLDAPALDAAIPPALRDPDNRWFGLSVRARSIAYDPDKVDPTQLSTYAALADPEWKGRLCLRNSGSVYTQSRCVPDRRPGPRRGAAHREGMGRQRRDHGQRRDDPRCGRGRPVRGGHHQPLLPGP